MKPACIRFLSGVVVVVAGLATGGPGATPLRAQAQVPERLPSFEVAGLTGRFAFTLTWTPEQMPAAAPPPGVPPIDPNGPSFFTALPEQLGLELVPAKGPVDVLVIDSVERPTLD